MSKPVRLASFCRLCLNKTKDKVPVFAEGNLLDNLLKMIEIDIDPNDEPNAVVCYDCVVTLEGFHLFKQQCHVNDEFVKTIPSKGNESEVSEIEEDEEERDEGDAELENIEEEDHLELSEAEEVFQEQPVQSEKSKKKAINNSAKKTTPTKSVKESPKVVKSAEKENTKATLDELQVLQDSYPDFFYFEKGSRSIYYTLVFYGERFNSALFSERTTYWQCIHRRRYSCPAQVRVTNDYKTFERHYDHTHDQLHEKEGQAFTPHEALPELFKICKRIVQQKKNKPKNDSIKEEDTTDTTFESKFQEFANESTNHKPSASIAGQKTAQVQSSDSEVDSYAPNDGTNKRKIKSNVKAARKKHAAEPKVTFQKATAKKPDKSASTVSGEDSQAVTDEEEGFDLEQIEQECDSLNVPKRPTSKPTLEELQVLRDSYPDYFYFEKGPRSIYYTLVYYGERFHSALFTERYTYWHCPHRRKYKCPAQVCVTNDYKTFERRYEHTHPELPEKEGQAFTPTEALPELFEACRKIVHRNRAKRRQKLLHKYQFLNSINSSLDQPSNNDEDSDSMEMIEVIDDDGDDVVEDENVSKDMEYEELIDED